MYKPIVFGYDGDSGKATWSAEVGSYAGFELSIERGLTLDMQ